MALGKTKILCDFSIDQIFNTNIHKLVKEYAKNISSFYREVHQDLNSNCACNIFFCSASFLAYLN